MARPIRAQQVDRRGDPKLALASAAQKLFATRGIDGPSLREIAAAAGHGNINAVQYHFGDKQGLVRAIFEANFPFLEQQRSAYLADCAARNALDDLPSLTKALFLPFVDLTDADGAHSYAAFNLQVQTSPRWQATWWKISDQVPVTAVIARMIITRMGDPPEPIWRARLGYVSTLILQMLVNLDAMDGPPEIKQALIDDAFAIADRILTPMAASS